MMNTREAGQNACAAALGRALNAGTQPRAKTAASTLRGGGGLFLVSHPFLADDHVTPVERTLERELFFYTDVDKFLQRLKPAF